MEWLGVWSTAAGNPQWLMEADNPGLWPLPGWALTQVLSRLHVLVSGCVFNRKHSIMGDTPHCQAARGAPRPLALTGGTSALLPGLLRASTPGLPQPSAARPSPPGPLQEGTGRGRAGGRTRRAAAGLCPRRAPTRWGAPGGAAPAPAPRPLSREAGAGPAGL